MSFKLILYVVTHDVAKRKLLGPMNGIENEPLSLLRVHLEDVGAVDFPFKDLGFWRSSLHQGLHGEA